LHARYSPTSSFERLRSYLYNCGAEGRTVPVRRTPRQDLNGVNGRRCGPLNGPRFASRAPPRTSFSVMTVRARLDGPWNVLTTGSLDSRVGTADERLLRRSSTSWSGPFTSARRRPGGALAAPMAGIGLSPLASEDLAFGVSSWRTGERWPVRGIATAPLPRVRTRVSSTRGRRVPNAPRCGAIGMTDGSATATDVTIWSGL
jgi:hypothetical protein